MKIGLVIPDSSWATELTELVETEDHQAIRTGTITRALAQNVDLVFAQWVGGSDLPLLLSGFRIAAEQTPPIPVVVLIRSGEIAALYRARAAGATDVLLWPATAQEVAAEIADAAGQNAVEDLAQRQKLRDLARDCLVGESPKFKKCLDDLLMAGRGDANVLLLGETGTGKEMMARAVHQLSRRAVSPFVVVNCPALKDTLWESELFGHVKGAFTSADSNRQGRCQAAGTGILMLDEIGYLALPQQATLLRLLEQRIFQRLGETRDLIFHARIISATSVDLDQAVRQGTFRQDLLGRLDQFRITIPPLRERRSDIAALANHFVRKHSHGKLVAISPSAQEVLENYNFPSNVREVENIIITSLTRAGNSEMILPKHLPQFAPATEHDNFQRTLLVPENLTYKQAREWAGQAIDTLYLPELLAKHEGNKSLAATKAGIDRNTLDQRLKKLYRDGEGVSDAGGS